jgi:hypothetical protein
VRGSRIRLEVPLLKPDQQKLWSGKYDGDIDDTFDWQDETARQAAVEVVEQVMDRERLRLRSVALADMSAEECVIASMMDMALLDEQSMVRNLEFLAAAIEKRPDYADGYLSGRKLRY